MQPKSRKNQHAALAVASLLMPGAVMAYVLACWKVLADLNVTSQFPITEGWFSRWQVWGAAAAILHIGASLFNRCGKARPPMQSTIQETRRKLANSRL